MTAVYIVTVVFTAVVVILAIIAGTILAGMRLRHRGLGVADKSAWDEETRLMQQLHRDLTKMETRIEALETILMEECGKDDK